MGNVNARKAFFDPEKKEYYFERNRESFPAILYFYQSEGYIERIVKNHQINVIIQQRKVTHQAIFDVHFFQILVITL